MVIESNNTIPYDALLILSFGGPEGRDDVIPFLKNVLRGRNVPRERMLEVARHYHHFDGVSPINDQNRALIAALEGLTVETPVGSRTLDPRTHEANTGQFWGPMKKTEQYEFRIMDPVTYIPSE